MPGIEYLLVVNASSLELTFTLLRLDGYQPEVDELIITVISDIEDNFHEYVKNMLLDEHIESYSARRIKR